MVDRRYDVFRGGVGSSSTQCCSCRIDTDSALAPRLSAPVHISTDREGRPATLRIDTDINRR